MNATLKRFVRHPGRAAWAPRLVAALLALAGAAAAQDDDEHGAAASAPVAAPASGSGAATARPVPEIVRIPLPGAGRLGGELDMLTQVFRPAGAGPWPVVLFSHGRAGDAASRAKLDAPVSGEQLRYWLARGVAVVAPIRPGYGATGGPDAERNGAHFEADGRCSSRPDYAASAEAAVHALLAALDWVRAQPWAEAGHVLLEGQSVGGFATVATAARQPPGVVGYINFAGGTGGSPDRAPGRSCDPAQLGTLYAAWGRTTRMPNLWIYAENDQYWGAEVPVEWHRAFAAGGSATTFVHAAPVPDGDGHGLSRHARRLWAADVDRFVASIAFASVPAPGPVPLSAPPAAPMPMASSAGGAGPASSP